jgi:hypothetical protein
VTWIDRTVRGEGAPEVVLSARHEAERGGAA